MKAYLPHYFKKIGITLVIFAIFLSIIGNVNELSAGIIAGYKTGARYSTVNADPFSRVGETINIISTSLSHTLIWISLSFSFSGFLLYLFSREKIEDEFIQKLRYMSLAKSLLITWIVASFLFIINCGIELDGFYILQFQLIVYVILYNYYKEVKYK